MINIDQNTTPECCCVYTSNPQPLLSTAPTPISDYRHPIFTITALYFSPKDIGCLSGSRGKHR